MALSDEQRKFAEMELAGQITKLTKIWGEDYPSHPQYNQLLEEVARGRPVSFAVDDRVYAARQPAQ